MTFAYRAVERIPKQLERHVVYHSEEFELAAVLCACGCGHRVILLVPDGHRVWDDNGQATVSPSIAVCDSPCKSHYFISNGKVEWLPAFSSAVAAAVMQKQIARHVSQGKVRPRGFIGRLLAAFAWAAAQVRALFTR